MKVEREEEINRLITELKANDSKNAGEYQKLPKNPKAAIQELVELGEMAVDPLIKLLRERSKFSCLYAIKVLGRIRDLRAVEPILDVFSSDELHDNFQSAIEHDQPVIALRRMSKLALEPILLYLKAKMEKGDELGICNTLELLAGIRDEKSFEALTNMLFYEHPKFESNIVQQTAIDQLEEYGDRRAVEYLAKLLENEDAREYTASSIKKLVPLNEYRRIIAPYAAKCLDSHREGIYQSLRGFEYPPRFEGDNANELNSLAQMLKTGKNLESLLSSVSRLVAFQGLISDKDEERLDSIARKLSNRLYRLEEKHKEEKLIIDGYIPEPVIKQEAKTYKGIAPESLGYEYPKLDTLRTSLLEWLKKQGFKVVKKNGHTYARKGTKNTRKGCYIHIGKDEEKYYEHRQRTWGLVHLTVWGEGWSTDEAKAFATSFWQHIHNKIAELLGTKKLQVETLDIQTKQKS